MIKAYPTFIAKEENVFLVYVPDLEIYTEGVSMEDAIYMARDAIGLSIIDKEDSKIEIAEPSTYEEAIEKAKADADDFDYSNGILTMVDVDIVAYRRKHEQRTVRRNVTLPLWLDTEAKKAQINVSRVLQEALAEKLNIFYK